MFVRKYESKKLAFSLKLQFSGETVANWFLFLIACFFFIKSNKSCSLKSTIISPGIPIYDENALFFTSSAMPLPEAIWK
jgi:hypothetical protein